MTIKKFTLVVLIVAAFAGGFFTNNLITPESSKVEGVYGKFEGQPGGVDFEPFWKAWNQLENKYVNPNAISNEARVWGAIEGLAKSFDDPYTVFLPPEESKLLEEDIRGNFSGVGMEIGMRDDILTVISPLKGTPADRAGIKAGDKIIQIDGETSINSSIDEAVKRIRGEKGTKVVLTIVREGEDEPREVEIVRDTINIPTIETELRSDGIFVISLFNFNANSPDLFSKALEEFVRSDSNKLILDLRNNPGGFLEAAIDISSWFLPAGKIVVVEDFGKDGKEVEHRSKGYYQLEDDVEMIILVNGGSASASEIVAGALSEHRVATLLGMQTFGKGSVQELVSIDRNTSLKVTVARWLTPEGTSISDGGLTPDVEVDLTIEDFNAGEDPQLDRAVESLNQ